MELHYKLKYKSQRGNTMKNALILINEIPVPSKNKTNLISLLSKEKYDSLHKSFLKDTVDVIKNLQYDLDIFIAYASENKVNTIRGLVPDYIQLFPQYGQTVEEKLKNAMVTLISDYKKVVLIGANVPQIQEDTIREAFELLDENNVCIGPTSDNGCYLVGMKDKIYDCVFDNIEFGQENPYENTINQCMKNYLKVGICHKYMDVYTIENIGDFVKEVTSSEYGYKNIPVNTLDFIEKYLIDKI
jgi:glycosyltransferase A (GT-A) superfamily protein (DUF2064 family)